MNATQAMAHPLDGGAPPAWACGWGEDEFGVYAEVGVGRVVQRMRWIPPGEFGMGSGEDDKEAYGDEKPQHQVRLTRGYWLGDTPVTQEFYTAVMGENPSRFQDKTDSARRPVENVDWYTARKFHRQLEARVAEMVGRELAGSDGLGFRLPTEAEWEFACRSGTDTSRYGPLEEVAWYNRNSGHQTHPVGLKSPSPWGLYDMLGNVWEWCVDGNQSSYPFKPPIDPVSYAGPGRRVRGGSWSIDARYVRAAYRDWLVPADRNVILGFRLARGPALPPAPASWENG